jgi:hypothetical protein
LVLDVPLAKSRREASVGSSEQIAKSVAGRSDGIPHAVELRIAAGLLELAVDATLLAVATAPSDAGVGQPDAHWEVVASGSQGNGELHIRVLGASVGGTVVDTTRVRGGGIIPHAPGIGVASLLGKILVRALA